MKPEDKVTGIAILLFFSGLGLGLISTHLLEAFKSVCGL